MTARREVVVGAGVAGLAAALRVRERDPGTDVVVFEAAARAGGTVTTERSIRRCTQTLSMPLIRKCNASID